MTEPFESLALTQSGSTHSGQVKYPAANTAYVLRTYFAGTEGGADYLVDEQTVADPASISVTIPTEGALVPTGEYYLTSFLMAEKTFTLEDRTEQTALAVIDSQMFDAKFAYTNINQPGAPADVALEFIGNEVMRAEWNAVDGADGYAVAIYQQNADGSWADTGFGYDLNSQTTSIDMALTVGGNGVSVNGNTAASVPAEKLSADKTYAVGVRAYRSIEGGSYYSAETASGDVYLPAYTPLEIALEVGGEPCGRDENGVFHAYVGGEGTLLTLTCAEADSFHVTRMDTEAALAPYTNDPAVFAIPDFTGRLMLRVDGVKGLDVTSVFLLVNRDVTPPVLTLSASIFFADRDSGEHTITGTVDAGSKILYGRAERIYAENDGSFTISGTLEEEEANTAIPLHAQDGAGNAAETTFTMPDGNVTVTAVWVSSGGSYTSVYPITVLNATNGTVAASHKTAPKGATITLTVAPDKGFAMDGLAVVDGAGAAIKLTDMGNGKFSPDATCTRAQAVTFLYRASGSPAVSGNAAFTDVAADAYYAAAVAWAEKNGITGGIGGGLFGSNQSCTRGQIVTFLYRTYNK